MSENSMSHFDVLMKCGVEILKKNIRINVKILPCNYFL